MKSLIHTLVAVDRRGSPFRIRCVQRSWLARKSFVACHRVPAPGAYRYLKPSSEPVLQVLGYEATASSASGSSNRSRSAYGTDRGRVAPANITSSRCTSWRKKPPAAHAAPRAL